MSSKCYQFPESSAFRQAYYRILGSDNAYLAEKTFPTIAQRLASKKVVNYSIVPAYAICDYHTYLDKAKNQSLSIVARMNQEHDFQAIANALETIAIECDCN